MYKEFIIILINFATSNRIFWIQVFRFFKFNQIFKILICYVCLYLRVKSFNVNPTICLR